MKNTTVAEDELLLFNESLDEKGIDTDEKYITWSRLFANKLRENK